MKNDYSRKKVYSTDPWIESKESFPFELIVAVVV